MKAYHSIPKVLAHNRWRVQDISAPRRVHHTRPVLFLRRHPNPKANNMPPLRHQILFRHFVKSCVFLQVLPLRRFSALPPLSRLSETIKVQSAYLFLSRHSPERQAQSLNRTISYCFPYSSSKSAFEPYSSTNFMCILGDRIL